MQDIGLIQFYAIISEGFVVINYFNINQLVKIDQCSDKSSIYIGATGKAVTAFVHTLAIIPLGQFDPEIFLGSHFIIRFEK
jgi:hypothetical protein